MRAPECSRVESETAQRPAADAPLETGSVWARKFASRASYVTMTLRSRAPLTSDRIPQSAGSEAWDGEWARSVRAAATGLRASSLVLPLRCGGIRDDRDHPPAASPLELHRPRGAGVDRVVLADPGT